MEMKGVGSDSDPEEDAAAKAGRKSPPQISDSDEEHEESQTHEHNDPKYGEMFGALLVLFLYLMMLMLQYQVTKKNTLFNTLTVSLNIAEVQSAQSVSDIWCPGPMLSCAYHLMSGRGLSQ